MARAGKEYRQLDGQFDDYDEDDGLNAIGRKNASHAEEIHDEVVRTCDVIVDFLNEQLPAARPDDWQEVCIDAAFDACRDREFHAYLPTHYDLSNYDTRALAMVMEHNLPILEFRRDAMVRVGEIRAFVRIRNLYEHKSQQLNNRRWRKDLEAVRSLRAKMQTDEQIVDEAYSVEELPLMEEDSALYLAQLDSLRHQIEAMTNTVLGMGDRLAYNARIDEDQFAELDRQHDTDEEHDRSIGELEDRLDANAKVDDQQATELRRQGKADAEHEYAIAEMAERLSELSERVAELEWAADENVRRGAQPAGSLSHKAKGLVAAAGVAAAGLGATLATLLRRK